jgi:hypothetical protein
MKKSKNNIEKNKQDDKNEDNIAEKERKEANSGKLDQVPFSAVKAYLEKYKGIGRLEDRISDKKNEKNGGKLISSKKGGMAVDDYNNRDLYSNTISNKLVGNKYQANNNESNELIKTDLSQDNYTVGKNQKMNIDSSDDESINIRKRKRGGSTFLPLDEREALEDYLEPIENGENNNLDYASRYANLLTRHTEPNHSEFEAIQNSGTMNMNLNELEVQTAIRATFTLSNDEALRLFESRYEQLFNAQRLAAEQVSDNQPGIFVYDDALISMVENLNESSNVDLQYFDSYMQKACEQKKYFQSVVYSIIIGLERNFNFDLDFATFFTAKFKQYLISFVDESNVDFISAIFKSKKSSVQPVQQFITSCKVAVEIKRNLIERQLDMSERTGCPTIFNDLQLKTVLDAVSHLENSINNYVALLQGQNENISKTNANISHLKSEGISSTLSNVRNKLAVKHYGNIAQEKFGEGQAQTMSEDPSDSEQALLNSHLTLKTIVDFEEHIRMQKVILLAEIDRFKSICSNAPFINFQPVVDFEILLRFLLRKTNPVYGSGKEVDVNPIDLQSNLTGHDIWIAEASNITSGKINLDLESKIIMAQGYIGALKIGEERAFTIVQNIMRRIGIDPLAPRIITHQMSDILKELGFYIEENSGLVQAMEIIQSQIKKTDCMDDDLEKIINSLEQGGESSEEYVSRLLDSILSNFAGPNLASGPSNDQLRVLSNYVCGSCNKLYSMQNYAVPITLPCGDVQCLLCTCSLKKCFKCDQDVPTIPNSPKLYNPSIHCPLDFQAMLTISAENAKEFMLNTLLTNNINGSFSIDLFTTMANLTTLHSDLLQAQLTSGLEEESKYYNFFVDCLNCTSVVQFQKIVVNMLTTEALMEMKKLVGMALQIADFYGGNDETRFLMINVIQALVSSAKIPTQGLAVQILMDRDDKALFNYCSSDNVKYMQDLYTTRLNFSRSSHCFKYDDVAPLLLNVIDQTIKILTDEIFDDVLNKPLRIFLIKEYQEASAVVRVAIESKNYSQVDSESKKIFKLFFNEISMYLKPVASMSSDAVDKCNNLMNLYNDSIFTDIAKKYPHMKDLECDPAIIDMKYVEVMVQHSYEKIRGMFDFTINKTNENQKKYNKIVALSSKIEAARSQLIYPGVKFDLPTDNSTYKNLPPYICAVSQDTLGNNPALPLYQFMMTTGTVLDNPYKVNVPPFLELAHTEGSLFYTGYDGFLEEYAPQFFDPIIKTLNGTILPPNPIIDLQNNRTQGKGANTVGRKMPNLPVAQGTSLIDQIKYELEKARKLKDYNETYYGSMFGSFTNDPLVKTVVGYMFGPQGIVSLQSAGLAVNAVEKGVHLLKNSSNSFLNSIYNPGLPGQEPGIINKLQNYVSSAFGDSDDEGVTIQNATEGAGMKKRKNKEERHKKLQQMVQRKQKKLDDLHDPKNLLQPILKATGILRLRKNIHDVHDHTVTHHNLKKNKSQIEKKSPQCEGCGEKSKLRVHNQSGEVVCDECMKSGVTPSRKIINEKNSEPLHTTLNPKYSQMSKLYNDYLFKDQEGSTTDEKSKKSDMRPANEHWEKIKESAKPFFRNDPDLLIKNFMEHKITEPMSASNENTYKHNLKTASLLASKLHSMLNLERQHMHPDQYNNLKHNYLMYMNSLPEGEGTIQHHNLVGSGDSFPTIASNINNARSQTKALSQTLI